MPWFKVSQSQAPSVEYSSESGDEGNFIGLACVGFHPGSKNFEKYKGLRLQALSPLGFEVPRVRPKV